MAMTLNSACDCRSMQDCKILCRLYCTGLLSMTKICVHSIRKGFCCNSALQGEGLAEYSVLCKSDCFVVPRLLQPAQTVGLELLQVISVAQNRQLRIAQCARTSSCGMSRMLYLHWPATSVHRKLVLQVTWIGYLLSLPVATFLVSMNC